MRSKIRHSGLVVKNLPIMKNFYGDVFGFTERKEMKEEGPFISAILGAEACVVTTSKLVASDQSMLELLCFQNPSTPSEPSDKKIYSSGWTHIALTVESIDEVFAMIQELKLPTLSKPQTSPDGKAKVFFCRDPEGNYLELVEEVSTHVS